VNSAGSSWARPAGGIHALNAEPNRAILQAYTIDFCPTIREKNPAKISALAHDARPDHGGHAPTAGIGCNRPTATFVNRDRRLHVLSPWKRRRAEPIMSGEGLLGGMWADREGYIDNQPAPSHAMPGRQKGAWAP